MMKRIVLLLMTALPVLLTAEPKDYEKITAEAKKGNVNLKELQENQKKCAQEYVEYFRKKFAACAAAQAARNAYVSSKLSQDKVLKTKLEKFNRGMIRSEADRKDYTAIYAKLSPDKEFMKLDRALWELKTEAALISVREVVGKGNDKTMHAYNDLLKDFGEIIEKEAVRIEVQRSAKSEDKGSDLFRVLMAEIEQYKKAADPKVMMRSKIRISIFNKFLFKQALEKDQALVKLMKNIEICKRKRVAREFELELKNRDAGYSKYIGTFGVKYPTGKKTMQEILLADKEYLMLTKQINDLSVKQKARSIEFMKRSDAREINELRTVVNTLRRSTGKKDLYPAGNPPSVKSGKVK